MTWRTVWFSNNDKTNGEWNILITGSWRMAWKTTGFSKHLHKRIQGESKKTDTFDIQMNNKGVSFFWLTLYTDDLDVCDIKHRHIGCLLYILPLKFKNTHILKSRISECACHVINCFLLPYVVKFDENGHFITCLFNYTSSCQSLFKIIIQYVFFSTFLVPDITTFFPLAYNWH